MKTLDEVIKVMDHVEFCCTNCKLQFDCDEVECFLEDALHYLKEFQGLSKMWNDKLDKEQTNPPLTWDELKSMEGKPVWIEPCKEWMLITEIETEPHIWLLSLDGMDYDMSLHEWQAYRKERK